MSNIQKFITYGMVINVFFVIYLFRIINNYQLLAILLMFSIFAVHLDQKHKNQYNIQLHWIYFIVALSISTLFSINPGESSKYLFMFFAITYISANIKRYGNYRNILVKLFVNLSIIEVIFVFLQYSFPSFINLINASILPPDIFESAMLLVSVGDNYSGIAGDLPNAMLFSSIVFIFGFLKFLIEKKKFYLLFMILGLISILLNGKRIAILIIAFSSLFIYYTFLKSQQKFSFKNFLPLIIILFLVSIVVLYTDFSQSLVEKNKVLIESGDVTNGREELNQRMFNIFLDNPILGVGPLATTTLTKGEFLGHNIYLMMLSECGILGLATLVYLLLRTLLKTIRTIYRGDNCLYIYMSLFIQIFFIIYGFTGNPIYGPIFLTTYILFAINENRNTYLPSRQ